MRHRMTHINSYLSFAGNCRQAMTYYKKCLGGELSVQTIGESPMAHKLPFLMKDYIIHGTLTTAGFVLMGSDMTPEAGLRKRNSVSLILHCQSEADIRAYFKKLSEGGIVEHPLKSTFFGALFGDLSDKFGNNWMLNFDQNHKYH